MTSESDLGDRIQRRILSEVREQLVETERKLKVREEQIERLSETIIDKQRVMDEKIRHADAQIALVAEKDHKIEMLQQRIKNVSEEYNQTHSGGSAKQQKPQNPNKATTLEDVYKLTGESYSKDDYRS